MVYIFGHKNPDTDSICSSIVFANYLASKGSEANVIRLGEMNNETIFILNKFRIKAPELVQTLPEGARVFLIDHNEESQSIEDLKNLDICGLVDHHKLNNFCTSSPIMIRVDALCSSSSVLHKLFTTNNYTPSKSDACLMIAAIISDSLFFRSPTTTDEDKIILNELNKIAQIPNLEEFAMEMFNAKSDLGDISVENLIKVDYKEFDFNGHKSGIGVIETVNPNYALGRKSEILEGMQKIKTTSGLDSIFLSVIDILKEENFTIVLGETEKNIIKNIYGIETQDNIAYLGNVISRKKQIIPQFTDYFNKQ